MCLLRADVLHNCAFLRQIQENKLCWMHLVTFALVLLSQVANRIHQQLTKGSSSSSGFDRGFRTVTDVTRLHLIRQNRLQIVHQNLRVYFINSRQGAQESQKCSSIRVMELAGAGVAMETHTHQ